MLRSPAFRTIARRIAHWRLRRLGGTETIAWAVRIPLVTLVMTAALVLMLPRCRRGSVDRRRPSARRTPVGATAAYSNESASHR